MKKSAEDTQRISNGKISKAYEPSRITCGVISANEKEEWGKRLEWAGIHRRFQPCNFQIMEHYGISPELSKAFTRARQYAENFDTYYKKGTGVIFMGPVGTMKTSMAVAVAQYVMRHGRSAFFIPMAELFDQLITMSKQRDNTEFLVFEERLRTTSLLILDDLGTEYPNDWIRNKVDAIISARYNRMLPVIITTNLAPGDIYGRYQERVYDRLKGVSLVIGINGESKRRQPKEIGGKTETN